MKQAGKFSRITNRRASSVSYLVIVILFFQMIQNSIVLANEPKEITFEIHSFYIEGNTLLAKSTLTKAVKDFVGTGRTADDVELARDALEKLYHVNGYPTVLVNIPEQTVENGVIKLQVIESRIKRVHVVGNKYFTMEHIRENLPSVQPGKVLYLPRIREELSAINRNPDLKVAPILVPGREIGTIDVELKVEDKLPLHGSLELNNRSTHTTTETRLNGQIRYDNLWQKSHSVNAQFQTSPQDVNEVFVVSTSYSIPAPWNKNQLLISYFIKSDSETATGDGFTVLGKGNILGFRYMAPLPPLADFSHNFTAGFDWKDFEQDSAGDYKPVEYIPFSFGYAASLAGQQSITQFSADVNFLLRDLFINDMNEFQAKRPGDLSIKKQGSSGNYLYCTLGLEHRHRLPREFSLFLKLDGQLADQPLINNEQFSAGGVNSVRGYKESELLGDNALHGTMEVFGPSLSKNHPIMPYAFYDFAWTGIREALLGEDQRTLIHGAGLGVTGTWKDKITFLLNWGMALESTEDTESGDHRVYFKIKYEF